MLQCVGSWQKLIFGGEEPVGSDKYPLLGSSSMPTAWLDSGGWGQYWAG